MTRLIALLVALSLAALGMVVFVKLDAPVARVTVGGALDDAERAQIRQVVRQALDGGLLSADLAKLRRAILALSWPREVNVRRAWPATLTIEVEKPLVVASWRAPAEGGTGTEAPAVTYVASDGSLVRLPGVVPGLPTFDCRLSEPRMAMEVYQRLSSALDPFRLAIVALGENDLGEWSLELEATGRADVRATIRLALGAERVPERLDRFLLVYRQHLADRLGAFDQVDARYDNGVAVRWQDAEDDATLVAAADGGRPGRQTNGSTMTRADHGI